MAQQRCLNNVHLGRKEKRLQVLCLKETRLTTQTANRGNLETPQTPTHGLSFAPKDQQTKKIPRSPQKAIGETEQHRGLLHFFCKELWVCPVLPGTGTGSIPYAERKRNQSRPSGPRWCRLSSAFWNRSFKASDPIGSGHSRQRQKRGPGRSLNGLLKATFLRAPNVSPELQLGRYKLPNMLPHHAEARLRAV